MSAPHQTVPRPPWLQELYPFAPHTLSLPAGPMHYLDEGQGRAVLMLHGNPTWSFFYRDLVRQLAPDHRCIVPDHLGCGLSAKPQQWSYRLQDHIANLKTLVASLNLDSFDLIVHDWGGAIGMGMAQEMPDKVRRLVVMNTAAFRSRRIPWRIAACRIPWLGACMVRGANAFAGAAVHMAPVRPLEAPVRRGFLYPYGNWHDRIATHRFVQDIPLDEGHPSYATLATVEAGLSKFSSHPMLLCWGLRDFCFDHVFLEEWQRRFPHARTEACTTAGHYLLEDAPEIFLPAIQSFLANQT